MSNRLRVAAVQMTSGADAAINLAQATTLVHQAITQGAHYIQLPEYAAFHGPPRHYREGAQRLNGPFVQAMADLATASGVTIHIGSLLETTDGSSFANTSVVLGPHGTSATYRKMHLFTVDLPNQITSHESAYVEAGNELVIVDIGAMQLGLSICFDLRFPELYRGLLLAGANVLGVPSAFSAVTGPAHFAVLLRARAIENSAFVVAATQAGVTREGLATYGHATILSPWGTVLAQSGETGPDVVIADINLDDVLEQREQLNTIRGRRPALYDGVVRRERLV